MWTDPQQLRWTFTRHIEENFPGFQSLPGEDAHNSLVTTIIRSSNLVESWNRLYWRNEQNVYDRSFNGNSISAGNGTDDVSDSDSTYTSIYVPNRSDDVSNVPPSLSIDTARDSLDNFWLDDGRD